MKRSKIVGVAVIGSLLVNAWLGYWAYTTEVRNRDALAYPAQIVAYRLTNLTRFADGIPDKDWADVGTRTWIYDSVREIELYGYAAERIPAHGLPSQVGRKLGDLARRVDRYRDDAHRVAFMDQGDPAQDRAKIQELARRIRDAGWGPEDGPGKPAGFASGRDWGALNSALDRFLAAQ
jgi:hypothetical protein